MALVKCSFEGHMGKINWNPCGVVPPSKVDSFETDHLGACLGEKSEKIHILVSAVAPSPLPHLSRFQVQN